MYIYLCFYSELQYCGMINNKKYKFKMFFLQLYSYDNKLFLRKKLHNKLKLYTSIFILQTDFNSWLIENSIRKEQLFFFILSFYKKYYIVYTSCRIFFDKNWRLLTSCHIELCQLISFEAKSSVEEKFNL